MSEKVLVSEIQATADLYLKRTQTDLLQQGSIRETTVAEMNQSVNFAREFYDRVAYKLAQTYRSGDLNFEQASQLASSIWWDMINVMKKLQPHDEIPTSLVLMEVEAAFDAGTFDHFGRSQSPVAEFTDPALDVVLRCYRKN